MRRFLPLLPLLVLAAPAPAQPADEALWLRYPAISPDGTRIAFEYRGDLWSVPSAGGEAKRLTTHVAYERSPVWSPDGRTIAFASDRHGNFDVFAMDAGGGPAVRLTENSAHDAPYAFTPDGKDVVFGSSRQDAPESLLSSSWLPELYAVPVTGGRARMLLTTPAERAQFRKDGGAVLYQDRKAYENEWRKHHTSSAARDVWMWTPATGEHAKLTTFAGEDRNPVWAPDGRSFWYLSEEDGTFNVWRRTLEGEARQVTHHTKSPARFLSTADDGTLCYAWDGGLRVMKPGDAEPHAIRVTAPADDRENGVLVETVREGATEMAPSPSGEEVAFIVRGDVFVCTAKHGTTRRITATSGMERSLSWSPDGRALWYSAERGGSWNLCRAAIAAVGEDRLVHATTIREEVVLATAREEQQPVVSPDGKLVAYLEDRDALAVLDVASRVRRIVVPADLNYSYSDGDIRFAWSPDSRYLATYFVPRNRWIGDLGIVDVATGQIENVTESGYEEDLPEWTPDGRSLVFRSDRLGRRSHGSWGSDSDVFAFDLTRAAHVRATLSKEDFELAKKAEEKAAAAASPPAKEGEAAKKDDAPKPVAPVVVEWEHRERRIRRLTLRSAPLGGIAVSPDGETLVYWAQVDHTWDLWAARPRSRDEKRIVTFGSGEPGDVVFAKDGKGVFARTSEGAISRITLSGTDGEGELSGSKEDVAYSAELTVDLAAERAGIFDHAWRQAQAKFYEPSLHGTDWQARRDEYARFLPHVTNGWDMAELLSEMLGELNASHTGAGYRPDPEHASETAALGLVYDTSWTGDGLRVAEVLPGGPFDRADSKIGPGATILAVDGVAMPASADPARALDRKAGKRVTVTAKSAAGEDVTDRVLAISGGDEAGLVYRRWTERCERLVASLSGGRVGYVHVRGMDEDGFRTIYREALGRDADAEALLVDTRWNGGGWLHDDLVAFLGARDYLHFRPRGKELGRLGTEPQFRWTRPSAVLVNEGDYSDAHVFPYAYRALGIGKIVGAPVAGTGTAVWWERQVDGHLVFGIPQVGLVGKDGRYLENQELVPDVLVLTNPADAANGLDRQIEAAVKLLLAEADARK